MVIIIIKIEGIPFLILTSEIFFSVYVVSKFVGEIVGPQKAANKDDYGNYYGGFHYEHGIHITTAALMIFGMFIECAVFWFTPLWLENIIPLWASTLIEAILLTVAEYWMLKKAFEESKINEVKVKQLNREIGYEY